MHVNDVFTICLVQEPSRSKQRTIARRRSSTPEDNWGLLEIMYNSFLKKRKDKSKHNSPTQERINHVLRQSKIQINQKMVQTS